MGRYFDFTPVKPWAGGLGDVGQALYKIGDAMRESDKADMERAKTEAYRAQVAAQIAGNRRQEIRDQVKDSQAQQDRMRDTTQRIAAAVTGGQYGVGAATAASSQFEDPRHPGQMAGVGFTKQAPGPAPVAPTAPVEPQAPDLPDYVQVMTPEQARTKAIHDALVKQGRPVDQPPAPDDLATEAAASEAEGLAKGVQDTRAKYANDQKAFGEAQTAYEPQVAAYQSAQAKYQDEVARPNVELSYPTGQKVVVNPREGDVYKDYEAKQQAKQLLDAAEQATNPLVKGQMQLQASEILARLSAADKGAINNVANQTNAATARADLQGKKITSDQLIQSRHDQARVDAARLRGHGGGMLPGADEGRVMTEVRDNIKDVTEKGGLRDQLEKQEGSIQVLRAHPENNTNWTNAIDAMIRTNTGRAAIISQYKMYTGKTVGWEDAANQFMAMATNNSLTPAQKRSLFGAMQDSLAETSDRYNQAFDIADEYSTDSRVKSSPPLQEGVKRTLHSAFRGGKRKKDADRSVPGVDAPPAASPPPKVDETKLSPQDQGLVKSARAEIAKKGSMAASAKAYLQHLGLQ